MIELSDILASVPCKVTSQGSESSCFTGIATNSKNVESGQLFFALPGQSRDGHDFVSDALESGATGAVVSKDVVVHREATLIKVQDTLEALQALGTTIRRKYNPLVIAVTGSAGKTTTKDMIAHVVSRQYQTVKSPSSYNNHIGVPLTLSKLTAKYSHAVVELGMNHAGEIASLSRMVEPDIGIITNIGLAHIGNMGTQADILREKATLFDHVKSGGTCIINGDDPLLRSLIPAIQESGRKLVTVGLDSANDVWADGISRSGEALSGKIQYDDHSTKFLWKWGARHFVYAGLFSIASGLACGVDAMQSAEALGSFELPSGRLNSISIRPGLRVIDDSYNASPDAMLSALETLRASSERVKVAVLGDMRELGSFANSCHEAVGRAAASAASHLITVGSAGDLVRRAAIQEGFDSRRAWSVASPVEAYGIAQSIVDSSSQDCVILLKGARFAHMERVRFSLTGVTVACDLTVCPLYINCSACPELSAL